MKTFFGTISALSLVIGFAPVAMADLGVRTDAQDFAINVIGTELPVSVGQLDYPYKAADRGISGECSIRLQVAESGSAGSYDVTSCSNVSFRRAAEEFARTLSYEPDDATEVHELTVSWTTD
jgi:outer membrane biosynthesis protein TonB